MRKAPAESDRADGKKAAARFGLAVDDVSADAAVLSRCSIEDTRQQKLFERRVERWSMTFRKGYNRRKIGRTQSVAA